MGDLDRWEEGENDRKTEKRVKQGGRRNKDRKRLIYKARQAVDKRHLE